MKYHDFNATLGLSLVTDDDGSGWRYEPMVLPADVPLEATPLHILKQGHYVANAIAQGLVIVGSRIRMDAMEWQRVGPLMDQMRRMGGMG